MNNNEASTAALDAEHSATVLLCRQIRPPRRHVSNKLQRLASFSICMVPEGKVTTDKAMLALFSQLGQESECYTDGNDPEATDLSFRVSTLRRGDEPRLVAFVEQFRLDFRPSTLADIVCFTSTSENIPSFLTSVDA